MPVLSATPDVHYLDVSAFNARNPLLQSHAGVCINLFQFNRCHLIPLTLNSNSEFLLVNAS